MSRSRTTYSTRGGLGCLELGWCWPGSKFSTSRHRSGLTLLACIPLAGKRWQSCTSRRSKNALRESIGQCGGCYRAVVNVTLSSTCAICPSLGAYTLRANLEVLRPLSGCVAERYRSMSIELSGWRKAASDANLLEFPRYQTYRLRNSKCACPLWLQSTTRSRTSRLQREHSFICGVHQTA